MPDGTEREINLRRDAQLGLLTESFINHFVDVLILLCVANRRFLQLGALRREDNEAICAFKYVHQDDHFEVLHQVERAGFKIGWIFQEHFANLLIDLPLHALVQVSIADFLIWIGFHG